MSDEPDPLKEAFKQAETEIKTSNEATAGAASSSASSSKLPMPGLEFLGCGYDIFDRYAHPESVKARIFTFDKDGYENKLLIDKSLPVDKFNIDKVFITPPTELQLVYSVPKCVSYRRWFLHHLTVLQWGQNSQEQTDMQAHVELGGESEFFGGEFTARYGQTQAKLETSQFWSVTALSSYFSLSMENLPLDVRPYMTENAKKDINDPNNTPEAIFAKYGTHYLSGVTIGSKIIYGHTVDTSKTTSSYSAQGDLEVRYGAASAGAGGNTGAQTEQSSETTEISFDASGVSDSQISAAKKLEKYPLDVLKDGWHDPTLVDFPKGKVLKPIWGLCDQPARGQELLNAFKMMAKHATEGPRLRPLYLMKKVVSNNSHYCLAKSRTGDSGWDKAEDKPLVYVFSKEVPGTVPLFEYDRGDGNSRRYETSAWQPFMDKFSERSLGWGWKKRQEDPLGYVYDALKSPKPDKVVDVYAYYPRNDGNMPRLLYSTNHPELRDKEGWREHKAHDDVGASWAALPPKMYEYSVSLLKPDVQKIMSSSNVHWWAPRLE